MDDQVSPSQDVLDERITFVVPSSSDFEKITGFKNFTSLWSGHGGRDSNGIGLSAGSDSDGNLQSLFVQLSSSGDDYHLILNYLWIGAVVALIALSVVFILFSFYFYRKFTEWKKCNKDIQSQIPNDLQRPYGPEDVYCKIESPPCYTIATGLPTYSEALLYAHYGRECEMGYLWLPSRNFSQEKESMSEAAGSVNCSNAVLKGTTTSGSDNECTAIHTDSSQSLVVSNLTDVVVLS